MKTIAFYLRKLADLFDSRIHPSVQSSPEIATIEVRCDATQAMATLEKLREFAKDVEAGISASVLIQGSPPTVPLPDVPLGHAEPGELGVIGYSNPKV
mgnify:CR=1 FL=1